MTETNYIALPEGTYDGKNGNTSLRIIKQNLPNKEFDGGVKGFSWLVGATEPTNGQATIEGTAFLNLHLRQSWLSDEAMCLVFNDGLPDKDAPTATSGTIATVNNLLQMEARDAVVAAGTPDDQVEDMVAEVYDKLLTRIKINVSKFNRLKHWAGFEGTVNLDNLEWLSASGNPFTGEGGSSTEFTGKIVPSNDGSNSEVKTIFGKKA